MDDLVANASVEGTIIAGKYKVLHVLGRGGMGDVVAAEHLHLRNIVAIKILSPHTRFRADVVTRFLQEARATVRLRSEHIARVLDMGTLDNGLPYIVMERLEGRDFDQIIQARGSLPPQEAAAAVMQACEALAEAHSMGIVHRDLKPSNLFLTNRPDNTSLVKVLDFGISKIAEELGGEGLTSTTDILGTPAYMSPEQIKSSKLVDERTDIWSLGLILAEFLCGRPVFRASTKLGVLAQITGEEVPELGLEQANVPPGLAAIVRRCLEKDPAKRYQSVAALARELAPFAGEGSIPPVERMERILGRSETTRVWNASSRTRRRMVWIALAGALIGIAIGILSLRSKEVATTSELRALPTMEPSQEPAVTNVQAPPEKPPAAPAPAASAEDPARTVKAGSKSTAPAGKSTLRTSDPHVRKATSPGSLDGLEDRK
jgi:serine/threonine protein kinase